MPEYTLDTDSTQETLLTWIVQQYNIEHETSLTNAQYVTLAFPRLLSPYETAYAAFIQAAVIAAYGSADTLTKAQVNDLLGVS